MINAKAVAQLLGLSSTKVYELARAGALVSYRFGDAVRFDQDDVVAYKESCKVVVPPMPAAKAPVSSVRLVASDPLGHDAGLAAYFRAHGLQPRPAPASVAKARTPRKARPHPKTAP